MSLYRDILDALRGRSYGANDVDDLRREVDSLRRLVARLAEIAASEEPIDPALVREMLRTEAGVAPDAPLLAQDEPEPTPLAESPYRGAAPATPGELRCHRCLRKLEPDDPELSAEEGRVCFACFQRPS